MTAKKEVKHYLQISLSYDWDIVVPLDEGIQVIDTINSALLVDATDYRNPTIKPNDKDDITVKMISADKVKAMQMAHTILMKADEETQS